MGGDRRVCVSRELTKFFEENRRGSLAELAKHYTENPPKGEIVITVGGKDQVDAAIAEEPQD
jgi:16S rRNA (cytidine1402-2'-O)-methyltransferase